ncbi:OsmC family protein [Methanococcus voltae]|uniref:OsmC family protein n=1 Tax=Methanococcus voltae TaxID=2188 RepID=UPI001AE6AD3C|nr:OsmC family protein [Methanococcus voltae]MBP2172796.1 putative OsmC-like protein [Methanococcus voltae]
MGEATIKLAGKSIDTKLNAEAHHYQIISDEPVSLGGKGEAPNPMEYLLMAYAGCLNALSRYYIDLKGLEVREMFLEVHGKFNTDKLKLRETTKRAGFEYINVSIKFDTDEPIEKIEEIVKMVKEGCPMHDNITNPTPTIIDYKIKDMGE